MPLFALSGLPSGRVRGSPCEPVCAGVPAGGVRTWKGPCGPTWPHVDLCALTCGPRPAGLRASLPRGCVWPPPGQLCTGHLGGGGPRSLRSACPRAGGRATTTGQRGAPLGGVPSPGPKASAQRLRLPPGPHRSSPAIRGPRRRRRPAPCSPGALLPDPSQLAWGGWQGGPSPADTCSGLVLGA